MYINEIVVVLEVLDVDTEILLLPNSKSNFSKDISNLSANFKPKSIKSVFKVPPTNSPFSIFTTIGESPKVLLDVASNDILSGPD